MPPLKGYNPDSMHSDKRQKPRGPTLSVVVPVYNESDNVEQFYLRTRATLEGLGETFEIIYVNDGSVDDTLEIVVNLAESDSRVKAIDLSRNFGKEIAVSAGLDYANGAAVILMDVDMQDPPEVIPDLLMKWREGYDVVYATRSEREGDPYFKKVTAAMFYRLIRVFSKIDIPKDTGDFRLMDRKVIAALGKLKEQHRFMKGLFSWVGFKQVGIYYKRNSRYSGKTKWNYRKLFGFAIEGITSFSYVPLQIATYFGLIVSLFAFAYGAFILLLTLISGNPVPGYPSLVVIFLFLGGIQLLCIGVIGEYVGRIYNEVKRRPLYVVREVIDLSKNSGVSRML
jgi:polyisoprenyl-phosphate glycosyltransferase